MHNSLFYLLALVVFSGVSSGQTADGQIVVSQHFPGRERVGVLCWSIPEEGVGTLSQIVVFETDRQGTTRVLWQSPLDNSYAPQIRFIPEIVAQGLPLSLVQRQTGASESQLDVIGKTAGRIGRLLQIDGFKFDVERLDDVKLPFIIAHMDASILDVPEIYRWNGTSFAKDSSSHPNYYRQLLADDKQKLPEDSSGAVLVNLSRIALLAGDRASAKELLDRALSRERSKGDAANQETLRLIAEALRSLERRSR
jgi:hypothetical protein